MCRARPGGERGGLVSDYLVRARCSHIGLADRGDVADPGFREVVEQSQGCRTFGVRAFLDGDEVGQDRDPERMVRDRFRILYPGQQPSGSRELLKLAGFIGEADDRDVIVTFRHGYLLLTR
jgi:hypothetical protein